MKLSTTSFIQFGSRIGVTIAGFVASIFFARVLGADTLGTYFLAIAVIGWLEFASQLGVTTAIQKRVSEREDSAAYFNSGGLVLIVTTTVVVISLLLAREWVADYIGAGVVIFVAAMLLANIINGFANSGLRGYHRVSTAATLEFVTTVVRMILQVGFILAGYKLVGMMVGYTIAFGLVGVLGLYLIIKENTISLPARTHITSTLKFTKYSWLGSLQTQVSGWMDTVVLGFFVSNGLVGIYNVSWNLGIILALASQSLASALFPTLSKLDAKDDLQSFSSILNEAFRYAGILCFPGIVGLAIVGPKVLRVYGSEFVEGAEIAVLIGVYALLSSYQGQFQTALNALDRPDLAFRVNAILVVVNITGNFFLVATIGWIGAAIATTVSMGVALGYGYILINQQVNFTLQFRDIGRQITAAILMGLVVYAVQNVVASQPYYYVVIPIGIGVITYSIILLSISRPIREKTFEIIDSWRVTM